MARGLDELRNLSKGIERKKQEAEKQQKLQRLAQQEDLSTQAKLKKLKMATDAGSMASRSARMRNIIVASSVVALVILWVLILRSVKISDITKAPAYLAQEDIAPMNTTDPGYQKIHKFAAGIIASSTAADDVTWNNAVPQSWREQSTKKIRAFNEGSWTITQISHNQKLDFYTIQISEKSTRSQINLRGTENVQGKISLVLAY